MRAMQTGPSRKEDKALMKTDKNDEPADQASAQTHLLVVDDDTCIFDIFHQMFPAPQFRVETAAHGRQAIALARSQQFDVAFVDFYLTGVTGEEVGQALRKAQPLIKIVLMSGYLVEERAAMMEKAGASAFLTKPFSAENTRDLVARLLKGRKP